MRFAKHGYGVTAAGDGIGFGRFRSSALTASSGSQLTASSGLSRRSQALLHRNPAGAGRVAQCLVVAFV
jgi:hypothetical protein